MKQKILQTVARNLLAGQTAGRCAAGRRAVGRRSCGALFGGRWLGGSLALPFIPGRASVLASRGGANLLMSLLAMFALLLGMNTNAQVNSGSNGSDGALDFSAITYSTNIVINMADHPNGIYQYTYVTIPSGVTVTFVPNANNTPVYWLVQNNVVINGIVNVSGQSAANSQGAMGGPSGYQGGNGSPGSNIPGSSGQGPGGGSGSSSNSTGGSYNYGNQFLIPLLGGSGGGGAPNGGGGGGGALLIATSASITVGGAIHADGGSGYGSDEGAGSGGAIRLVATQIFGSGSISANGGSEPYAQGQQNGGAGRIRFDTYDNEFHGGGIGGQFTQGSQFIIIPTAGQLPQLTVTSVGGVPVSASPTGVLSTPDAVLSAQQNNPIPIVVSCANLPLNSQITVSVKPASGAAVSATGLNSTGTVSSSTATISIVIPRGGGVIYATAATSN